MREFSVRIVLSELTIVADSAERAEEIAIDILDSDARTRLSHGLCVEACEVEEQGPTGPAWMTSLSARPAAAFVTLRR